MEINIYSTLINGEKVVDYISFLSKDANYFLEVSGNAESIRKKEISKLEENLVRMGADYYSVETLIFPEECKLEIISLNSEKEPIEFELIKEKTTILNISLGMDELVIEKFILRSML
jgi:hypothetical protein